MAISDIFTKSSAIHSGLSDIGSCCAIFNNLLLFHTVPHVYTILKLFLATGGGK